MSVLLTFRHDQGTIAMDRWYKLDARFSIDEARLMRAQLDAAIAEAEQHEAGSA